MINQPQTLSAYVQPRSSGMQTATQASEPIQERGDDALDLDLFYAWIAAECYLSPRVSGSVRQLWEAYAMYAKQQKVTPERFAFVQAMAAAFLVRSGMAGGVCLARERDSYLNAKPVGVPHLAFRKESLQFRTTKPITADVLRQEAA